ncbi:MAG: shikimate dehydrogenase [Solirubrobacterales bacterium]
MAVEHLFPTGGRFGVVGDPVGHSRSPQLHRAAYAALGIDADYQRLPIPADLFDQTVRALHGSGFCGVNVTIPHKTAALAVADECSADATAIGAANTLTLRADGTIRADNTDAPGLLAAIGTESSFGSALVLGAGGTARAAVHALASTGTAVTIWNRTTAKALELANEFGVDHASELDASNAQLVVNTTAVGMDPRDTVESLLAQLPLDHQSLRGKTVVDFVYRQNGSPLALLASESGATVIEGSELLVRQAALSFELWFDREPPLEVMRAAFDNPAD